MTWLLLTVKPNKHSGIIGDRAIDPHSAKRRVVVNADHIREIYDDEDGSILHFTDDEFIKVEESPDMLVAKLANQEVHA